MASSSSYSRIPPKKHDVFISFRGQDTRRGFLSHLQKELCREKIDAYVDDKLERGDEISSSLFRAIEESQISLIILSENYPSSKWCLDELAKIMECMERDKQTVLPIFYAVDPSDVRHQKRAFGDAFAKLELRFQENRVQVQNWRSALSKAADLSGYDSSRYRNDSEVIDDIVKDVLLKLNHNYPSESKGLVGIDQHLACIESLLETESKEVQVLGIWGMSGIGKTTVAQAAFDKFSSNYEGCYFLENVREESQRCGLRSLREQLIFKLQEEESAFLRERFTRRKVFVVLDDVSTLEQLQYLVKDKICWGPGSTVIVTSKDKQVFKNGGVHAIHEVKELDFEESLKLFSLNAFKKRHPEKGYGELSKRAVAYAKGLPLALKVLGLCLHSRGTETWESTLRKLEKHPRPQIQEALKVSYDRLDDVEKDIFLDIAFFYKGEDKDHVIRLLDANNLFGACGINELADKALITISNDNVIQMHDLIQEMGWEIVRQQCKEDPGRRSRLRDFHEVYDVLKNNTGTDAIKGIVLYASLVKDLQLNVDAFKKMKNLRVIKFYSPWHVRSCNMHHPTSFESFSDELRHIEWDGYPFKSLPSSFYPEKLAEHSIPNGHVKKLWKQVQDYILKRKRINLGRLKQSMDLFDFSEAQIPEWEDVCSCESLFNVDPHVLSLSMVVALDLVFSKDLRTLSTGSNYLRYLGNFDVSFCFSVKEFSLSSKEMSDLDLVTSKFKILYSSIGSLSELRRVVQGGSRLEILPINELCCLRSFEELNLSDCRKMNQSPKLHILFDALLSLQELFLAGCSDFFKVPDIIGTFSSLKYLGLKGSSIDSLPPSIKNLSLLKTIYLRNCRRLRFIPELPPSIMHLDATNCTSLETVFTLTTSTLRREDIGSYFFSFVNCMKLDEHSLCNIMDNAYLPLKQAVHNNFEASVFCYPSSRLPEWFRSKQTAEASITMQFSPAFDELLGFIFGSVLPRFASNEMCPFYLKCLCYFEDGEKLEGPSICDYAITELYSDHVFLWYDLHYSKRTLEGIKTRRGNGEDITYFLKVSFEFHVVTCDGDNSESDKHEGLITECGVYPIYASEQQMKFIPESKKTSKRGLKHDEQE